MGAEKGQKLRYLRSRPNTSDAKLGDTSPKASYSHSGLYTDVNNPTDNKNSLISDMVP